MGRAHGGRRSRARGGGASTPRATDDAPLSSIAFFLHVSPHTCVQGWEGSKSSPLAGGCRTCCRASGSSGPLGRAAVSWVRPRAARRRGRRGQTASGVAASARRRSPPLMIGQTPGCGRRAFGRRPPHASSGVGRGARVRALARPPTTAAPTRHSGWTAAALSRALAVAFGGGCRTAGGPPPRGRGVLGRRPASTRRRARRPGAGTGAPTGAWPATGPPRLERGANVRRPCSPCAPTPPSSVAGRGGAAGGGHRRRRATRVTAIEGLGDRHAAPIPPAPPLPVGVDDPTAPSGEPRSDDRDRLAVPVGPRRSDGAYVHAQGDRHAVEVVHQQAMVRVGDRSDRSCRKMHYLLGAHRFGNGEASMRLGRRTRCP